jgi:hypothetical protein
MIRANHVKYGVYQHSTRYYIERRYEYPGNWLKLRPSIIIATLAPKERAHISHQNHTNALREQDT